MSQSIEIDLSGSFHPEWGITEEDCQQLHPRLLSTRDEIIQQDLVLLDTGEVPSDKSPLDGHFYLLPEKILSEYQADRSTSELANILRVASRMQSSTEAVVILGIGGSVMGSHAMLGACCEPYFNERSRDARGGYPRIYFAGDFLDNDALQGVLSRLDAEPEPQKWGLIVISKSGQTIETSVALRTFIQVLDQRGLAEISQRVIPVTGQGSPLHQWAEDFGCEDIFRIPEGVGGRFSVLSAVGLLPAASRGLDVVQLLQGAADMNETFRTAPAGQNPVLDYVGAALLMQTKCKLPVRVLSVWEKSLEYVGYWYDQLVSESLGKDGIGVTPLTMVNTRDLHSRAQQHQQGRADKWIVNLSARQVRTDAVELPAMKTNWDRLNDLAGMPMSQLCVAARQGTNRALRDIGRPTMEISMLRVDEYGLGQFFQMMMLATVMEGRLLGVNPYGQPGVEAYKQQMWSILNDEAIQ
ncbi:MAG: glucose-6-phosphate isomerase [Planctomycetota bacterium]|nr:glucose-6-phosphate isomerase [Planctomycetota bacterium]